MTTLFAQQAIYRSVSAAKEAALHIEQGRFAEGAKCLNESKRYLDRATADLQSLQERAS